MLDIMAIKFVLFSLAHEMKPSGEQTNKDTQADKHAQG